MNQTTVKKSVTLDDVLAWSPCYPKEKLKELAGKRKRITALGILALPIDADDKMWAVLRNDFFTDRQLRHLACDFAEHSLQFFERERANDTRPRDAISIARRFADGNATQGELAAARDAAWDAARDAAWAAAWAAARAAARDAAWDAAWAAARDAAWDAETAWQIEQIKRVLRGELHHEGTP